MQAPERNKRKITFPSKHDEYIKLKMMPRNKQFQKQEFKLNWLCNIRCSADPMAVRLFLLYFLAQLKVP